MVSLRLSLTLFCLFFVRRSRLLLSSIFPFELNPCPTLYIYLLSLSPSFHSSCQGDPSLVLGVSVELSAEEFAGCWGCCCIPGGCAINHVSAVGPDQLNECGLFFLFGVIPLPYVKQRTRRCPGKNYFTQPTDGNLDAEAISYLSRNKIDFGPMSKQGCGLRFF